MIFTLEALQAGKGDALVLHYGDHERPRFVAIDGGPNGIYTNSLRPRLKQLHRRWKRASDDQLRLEMLMVSHVDDDHINGIIDWVKQIERDNAVPCSIRTFWYNSFDDILGNAADELAGRAASLSDEVRGREEFRTLDQALAVIASIAQGRELRARVDALNIELNGGFGGLIIMEEDAPAPIELPGGLKLHVVGPLRKRVEELRKKWDEHVRAHPDPVVLAAFADRSVPNLSSIVVVAEFEGRRMLLTGDARGDDVLDGLAAAGFLDASGAAHFDLIKMPHHGSNRNVTRDWLKKITADHYVISANGEHGNPDAETLQWICEARAGGAYTVYLTNRDMVDPKTGTDIGEQMNEVLEANPEPNRKVEFREDNELSVKAEIADAIDY